jgi:hypothetical protein
VLDGGGWLTPHPRCFINGQETWYPLYGRLGWPQGWSGWVRKVSPPQGFSPWAVQPVASHYTDSAVQAHLTGSSHDIPEGNVQHMPSITEKNYDVSHLGYSGLKLGTLLINVNHFFDWTSCGILIAGKHSQCVCYVCRLYWSISLPFNWRYRHALAILGFGLSARFISCNSSC